MPVLERIHQALDLLQNPLQLVFGKLLIAALPAVQPTHGLLLYLKMLFRRFYGAF
jgi:hypothetical protein